MDPEDVEGVPVTCAVPAAPSGALSVAPAGLATAADKVTELVLALAGTGTSASRFVGDAAVPGVSIAQVGVPNPEAHSELLNVAVSPLG